MRCDTCGAEFENQEKFCPQCGTPRPHKLPALNKVQSAGATSDAEVRMQDESTKQVLSTSKRFLLLAIILLIGLGLMAVLYIQFIPH